MVVVLSSECEKRYGCRGNSVDGVGVWPGRWSEASSRFGLYTLRQGNASSECVVVKYQV
jgi:hypothetical protein